MARQNLLEETLKDLSMIGKSEADVLAVEVDGDFASWDVFKKCARDYNYDSRCGRLDVNSDIRIIGKGFVLYREEFIDDSSRWSVQSFPENVTINPNITEIHFPID